MSKVKSKTKTAAYQRYFDGYVDARVMKKNGKGFKNTRIYISPWHAHKMGDAQWRKQKIIYGVLLLAAVAAYMTASFISVPGNGASYVAFIGCVALFTLVFAAASVIFYLSCPRKMTNWEYYRSVKHTKNWSSVSSASMAALAIAMLIHAVISRNEFLWKELLCAGLYLVSCAAMLVLHIMEKNTEYQEIENDTRIPFYEEIDEDE